jgi:polyisoprenyl-phosphate glycosyltransferase
VSGEGPLERRPSLELSIVVPVYGCAGCLPDLCRRVAAAVGELSYELVLIDDRSPDGAWPVILELASSYPVKAARLSRNFGQHAAITAGLAESTGEWVVVMDCDLQDRPEEIPRLLAAARGGYEVVFARRTQRRDSAFRRWAARLYMRMLKLLTGSRIEGQYGTFSVLSRKVVAAYLTLRDTSRHYLFIVGWLGFETTSIDVTHAERAEGESGYTFRKLVRHAVDGLVFQTTVLLRWIVYAGFAVALGGLVLAAVLVAVAVFSTPPPGWTSLAVLVLLVGGFIIISTGVAGLYIGKIFEQVKGRPLYIVDERIDTLAPGP